MNQKELSHAQVDSEGGSDRPLGADPGGRAQADLRDEANRRRVAHLAETLGELGIDAEMLTDGTKDCLVLRGNGKKAVMIPITDGAIGLLHVTATPLLVERLETVARKGGI